MKTAKHLKLLFLCFTSLVCIYIVTSRRRLDKRNVQNHAANSAKRSKVEPHVSETPAPDIRAQISTRGGYVIVSKFIMSDKTFYEAPVTMATQATLPFVRPHLELLCRRWDGPISLAVFAPSSDLQVAIQMIYSSRTCGDRCVREKVSFSLVTYNNTYEDIVEQLVRVDNSRVDCSNLEDISKIGKDSIKKKAIKYPINLARNVAREAVATKYVLSSDIELYPSLDVVQKFGRLIKDWPELTFGHRAFLLPTFEIEKNFSVPENKNELRGLYRKKKAVFFHSHLWRYKIKGNKNLISPAFHFTNEEKWMDTKVSDKSISVFTAQKSENLKFPKLHSVWEPFFIGPSNSPRFDEAMSWDGKRNKLSQAYEMCLIGYDYHVLDGAFLVHSPGIKITSRPTSSKAFRANREAFKIEIKRLQMIYGKKCET